MINVWIYENHVNLNTTILPLFQENIHFSGFFNQSVNQSINQSITVSLSLFNLLTHLACVAGGWPLSLQGKNCPAKKMTSFTDKNAPLWNHHTPLGFTFLGPSLVSAGSKGPGLSASTLLDRSTVLSSLTVGYHELVHVVGQNLGFAPILTWYSKIHPYNYVL